MPSATTHQSWPGVRRRRDSQPSIHLPRVVNLPGMKIARLGLHQVRLRREELVVGGDRAPADASGRQVGEGCGVMIGAHWIACPFGIAGIRSCSLSQPTENRSVRLVKVSRRGDRHDLKDLTVAIRFEGEYDASYTDGDNRDVLPTDTMKNTVYALAAREPVRRARGVRLSAGRGIFSIAIRDSPRPHRLDRAPVGPDRRGDRGARPGVRAARRRDAHGDDRRRDRRAHDRRRRRQRIW